MRETVLSGFEYHEKLFAMDIEASGLHAQSFPLQIAWCNILGRGRCYLLKPSTLWHLQSWDENAEALHGISLIDAHRRGDNR